MSREHLIDLFPDSIMDRIAEQPGKYFVTLLSCKSIYKLLYGDGEQLPQIPSLSSTWHKNSELEKVSNHRVQVAIMINNPFGMPTPEDELDKADHKVVPASVNQVLELVYKYRRIYPLGKEIFFPHTKDSILTATSFNSDLTRYAVSRSPYGNGLLISGELNSESQKGLKTLSLIVPVDYNPSQLKES